VSTVAVRHVHVHDVLPLLVQRWLIKIEDEDDSRGTAFVDVARVAHLGDELASVVENLAGLMKSNNMSYTLGQWPQAANLALYQSGPIDELRCQAENTVSQLLMRSLSKVLVMVTPRAFPTYRTFVEVRCLYKRDS
jgi:hypothetical protein